MGLKPINLQGYECLARHVLELLREELETVLAGRPDIQGIDAGLVRET